MTLKEHIIAEALRQFSVKGYMATSTADIINAVGTSKGGLYNHFKNKEELFQACLDKARDIWRQRNLAGIDTMTRPADKIIKILENYRDHYLADSRNFPGGCIFVNFAVELSDQQPHLAAQVNQGFISFRQMLQRLLREERETGGLKDEVDIERTVEMIFAGLLGACVLYTSDKSTVRLDMIIQTLIDNLNRITIEVSLH